MLAATALVRGSAPLLTAVGGAVFLQDRLGPVGALGVLITTGAR